MPLPLSRDTAEAQLTADSAGYALTTVAEHLHTASEALLPQLSCPKTPSSLIQLGRVLGLIELAQSEAAQLEAALIEAAQDG